MIFERVQFRKRETLHASREYYRQAKWEQKNIKVENIDEVIDKLRERFEPKVEQKPIPLATVKVVNEAEPKPVRNDYSSASRGEIPLQQSLPNIQIPADLKPTLNIPVEVLDQPSSALGRVCVVLRNYNGRPDRWTRKRID